MNLIVLVGYILSQHLYGIPKLSIEDFLIWHWRSYVCILGIRIPSVISTRRNILNVEHQVRMELDHTLRTIRVTRR